MTCIVGLEHEGDVYIGGDSAGVAGYSLHVRADAKVFTAPRSEDPWVFGFCGSFRVGQLLRYSLKLPTPNDGDDLDAWMATDFVDAVRACLDIGGSLFVSKGVEEGETFLVGYRGRLYVIESDFQVGRCVDPYVAIGCGDHIASGAMHALADSDKTPEEKILAALAASERFSAGVRAPFLVVSSARDTTPTSRRKR